MKEKTIIILAIIAGALLRFLYPLERVFHFDQEQIAVAAQKILEGHLTLIGPIAGTIQFFTGPLIYYVAAFWYFMTRGHPLASALIVVSIFLFSSLTFFFILKKMMPLPARAIFIAIYSLSALIVNLERVGWDPNFSFVSGGLVLAGLLYPSKKTAYLAALLGMFLSYQAHFSAFIIAVAVTVLCIWLRRWKYLIFSWLGLVISLLPTLIFDVRHNFLNTKGLIALATNREKMAGGLAVFQRFVNFLLVSLENVTKVLAPSFERWSLVSIGVLILGVWLLKRKSMFKPTQKIILLMWILFFPVLMMFYTGSIPEYYFLMQLPAFVFILTDLLMPLSRSKLVLPALLVGLFAISLGTVSKDAQMLARGTSLKNKLNAIEYIKKNQDEDGIKLVFDIDTKDYFGWEYLLDYLKIRQGEGQNKVHLIVPVLANTLTTEKFGGIGIWVDRRDVVEGEDYSDKERGVLFYYPKNYWPIAQAERYLYPGDREIKVVAFSPSQQAGNEAIKQSILYVYLPRNRMNEYLIPTEKRLYQYAAGKWIRTAFWKGELMDRKTLMLILPKEVQVFSFPQAYSWEKIESFLSQVEGI